MRIAHVGATPDWKGYVEAEVLSVEFELRLGTEAARRSSSSGQYGVPASMDYSYHVHIEYCDSSCKSTDIWNK